MLTVLAALLRLYQTGTLPSGLHHDEASNGMLALQILNGRYPVFFSEYTGKEAGFMYLVALSIRFWGQTVFALRLPAALVGVALVPAVFGVGRRIVGGYGALLAAGVTAVAPWLLHINRIGFRASLLPLLLTLWAWVLLRALDTNRLRDWLSTGVLLGLTAYTYTASRLVPVLVVLFVAYLVVWHRPLVCARWRGGGAMVVLAACVAAPLLWHYVHTPSDWSERLEQIGACSGLPGGACLLRVAGHFWATLLMVGVRGDPIGFFNLPGEPALPVWVGWLFYAGLLIALWRAREPAMALLVLWWVVMVVPGVLSKDSPHFLRTIGAAPPTMLLWALPLASLHALVAGRGRVVVAVLRVLPLLLLVLITAISVRDYFGRWLARPELYYDYMGYATDAARDVASLSPDIDLYLSEEYYRHPTYLYLAPRTVQAGWFDARFGWPLARPGHRSVYLVSPATPTDRRVDGFIQGATGENVLNEHGQYAYTRLVLESGLEQVPEPAMPMPAEVVVGPVQYYGMTVERGEDAKQGQVLWVTLFWDVQAETDDELRIFLHLVDRATGEKVGQHDVVGYPSREWRMGDQFVSLHTIPLMSLDESGLLSSPDMYALQFGLYHVVSGERVGIEAGEQVDVRDGAVVVPLALPAGDYLSRLRYHHRLFEMQ